MVNNGWNNAYGLVDSWCMMTSNRDSLLDFCLRMTVLMVNLWFMMLNSGYSMVEELLMFELLGFHDDYWSRMFKSSVNAGDLRWLQDSLWNVWWIRIHAYWIHLNLQSEMANVLMEKSCLVVKVNFEVSQHQHGSPPSYKAPHAVNFGAHQQRNSKSSSHLPCWWEEAIRSSGYPWLSF